MHDKDLFSPISFGMLFNSLAPSFLQLVFMLLVRGCSRQRLLEIFLAFAFFLIIACVGQIKQWNDLGKLDRYGIIYAHITGNAFIYLERFTDTDHSIQLFLFYSPLGKGKGKHGRRKWLARCASHHKMPHGRSGLCFM